MNDAISRKALVNHINSAANDLFERGGIVPSGILVVLRDEIESGKFDIPSTESEGEATRLRTTLKELIPLIETLQVVGDSVSLRYNAVNLMLQKINVALSQSLEPRVKPRESVQWFAEQMELKLRENDHKGGWEQCTAEYLVDRLDEEAKELFIAIGSMDADPTQRIVREAADVANFAMMIADIARKYAESKG